MRYRYTAALSLALASCAPEPRPPHENLAAQAGSAATINDDGNGAAQSDYALAGAAPAPLDSLDFVVNGLLAGSDSASVAQVYGAPDAVRYFENPMVPGSGDQWADWQYDGMVVHFTSGLISSHGVTLTGAQRATRRGLQVGDPGSKVEALYGVPEIVDSSWYYTPPADELRLHVIRVDLEAGRVRTIFLGNILD